MGLMRCPQLHRPRRSGADTSEGSTSSIAEAAEEGLSAAPTPATGTTLHEDRLALEHIFRPLTPRNRRVAQLSTKKRQISSEHHPTGSNLSRQKSGRLRIALLSEKIRRSFSREFQPSKTSTKEAETLQNENTATPPRSSPSTDILGSRTVSDGGYDSDARFLQTPHISQRIGDLKLNSKTTIPAPVIGRDQAPGLKDGVGSPSHDHPADEARTVTPTDSNCLGRSPKDPRSPISPLRRRLVRPTIPESILTDSPVNTGACQSSLGPDMSHAAGDPIRITSNSEREAAPKSITQKSQRALSALLRRPSSAMCLKTDVEFPVTHRSQSCEPAFLELNSSELDASPVAISETDPSKDMTVNSTDLFEDFSSHGVRDSWMPVRLASRLRLSTILSESRVESGNNTNHSERSPSIYSGNCSSMGSEAGLKLIASRRNNSSVDDSPLTQQFPLPPSFGHQKHHRMGHNGADINNGDSVSGRNSSDEQTAPELPANTHAPEHLQPDPSPGLALKRSNSSIIQSRFIENLSDTRLSTIPASNPQSPITVGPENDRVVSDGWLTEGKRRGYGYSFVSDDESDSAALAQASTNSPGNRSPLVSGHPSPKIIVWKRRKAEGPGFGGRSVSYGAAGPMGDSCGASRLFEENGSEASDSDSAQPPVLIAKKTNAISNRKSFTSWTRFPSHTRAERNASAGAQDNVVSRDFDSGSSPSSPRTRDNTSLAPSESQRSEAASSYMEKGRDLFLSWIRSRRSSSVDKGRRHWGKNNATAGKEAGREHPGLETIADSPVARRGDLENEDDSRTRQPPSIQYESTKIQSENTPHHGGPALNPTYDGTAADDNDAAFSETAVVSIGPQSAEAWSHLYEDCVERLHSREVSRSSTAPENATMSPAITSTAQEYPSDRGLLEPSTSTELRDSTVEYKEEQFSNETRTRDSLLQMVKDMWGSSGEGVRASASA